MLFRSLGLLIVPSAAFLIPYILFGLNSPLAIALFAANSDQAPSRIAGNVYALSTVGSVLGALLAAYRLIPTVGLVGTLRLTSLAMLVFAALFFFSRPKHASLLALLFLLPGFSLALPDPSFQWNDPHTLLYQGETQYSTVRVFQHDTDSRTMNVGYSLSSGLNLKTMQPLYTYATTMLQAVGDPHNLNIAVIGGAGHALAHALEAAGANVTEVEIDPAVAQLSDQWFGPLQHPTIIADGRTFLDHTQAATYDVILLDCFIGPYAIPPQLVTRESYQAALHALKPGGLLVQNIIARPEGPYSKSMKAIYATALSIFPHVVASQTTGTDLANPILAASTDAGRLPPTWQVPNTTQAILLTDDLNPSDLLFDQSVNGTIYYKTPR